MTVSDSRFAQSLLCFFFSKTREELTETREGLQQMKEKLVGQEESFRKKGIDFDAEVLSLRKANAELEVTTMI